MVLWSCIIRIIPGDLVTDETRISQIVGRVLYLCRISRGNGWYFAIPPRSIGHFAFICRNKMVFTKSLPLSAQKPSQKVCQLLCVPHPLRFSFDHHPVEDPGHWNYRLEGCVSPGAPPRPPLLKFLL